VRTAIDTLIEQHAGPSLLPTKELDLPDHGGPGALSLPSDLASLLARRNGFYAFESSLFVLPWGRTSNGLDLASWNAPDVWRREYKRVDFSGLLFFAMDIFGDQFWRSSAAVGRLETETGTMERMGSGLEEWAAAILANCRFETGWPLAQEWQSLHGPIPVGHRLVPTIPFAFEGKYEVSNLFAMDTAEALRFRGHLATQMADVPIGTQVEFRVVD